MVKNNKSDVAAKIAFKQDLESRGYTNVEIKKAPSDIIAQKDGQQWYFEIKKTSQDKEYFGAATLTEWEQALTTPDNYRFVIAKEDITQDSGFEFIELTPEELMASSTIPPTKIYFNVRLDKIRGSEDHSLSKKRTREKKGGAIHLNIETFNIVKEAYEKLRKISE